MLRLKLPIAASVLRAKTKVPPWSTARCAIVGYRVGEAKAHLLAAQQAALHHRMELAVARVDSARVAVESAIDNARDLSRSTLGGHFRKLVDEMRGGFWEPEAAVQRMDGLMSGIEDLRHHVILHCGKESR